MSGAKLEFEAAQWIAPGDRIRVDLADGSVDVEVTDTSFTVDDGVISDLDVVVRVLTRARGELDDLRDAAPAPDQARLGTAAAGITLVLGWLTQTSQALADVAGDIDIEMEEPAPEPVPEPPGPAPAPTKAKAAKVAATRPAAMPNPGEDQPCEVCGATVSADDAQFSWARHRKILCRTPDGGCFKKHTARPAKAEPETPAAAGEETT